MYVFYNTLKPILCIDVSSNAKLIYIEMLDRYKLSFVNDWFDNGLYIYYSISNIQKSIGVSRPTAIKILNELEENGYIIKQKQKGKPTKIYLVENDFTKFALKGLKKKKKSEQIADIYNNPVATPEYVEQEEHTEQEATEQPEVAEIEVIEDTNIVAKQAETDTYTSKKAEKEEYEYSETEVERVFKKIIGRRPDKSYIKTIVKRLKETSLTMRTLKDVICRAKNARKPEAYIISMTTVQMLKATQSEPEPDAPLEDWELDWIKDIRKEMDKYYNNTRNNNLA